MLIADVNRLLAMSQNELDAVFSASPAGEIPDGYGAGTALMLPGSRYNAAVAQAIRTLAWQGKRFYRERGILTNSITPMRLPSVVAFVYQDASRFDGKPCIVLDYSQSSLTARYIRDEIRLIAPETYLGRAYICTSYAFSFALVFRRAVDGTS